MRNQIIIALFSLLLVGVGTYWFLQNYEKREVSEYMGLKGEARTNNLFAARLFLKRMGIPAERHDVLAKLPSHRSTIILNTQRYTLSQQRIDQLLAWVEQGGHLITRARFDNHEDEDRPKRIDKLQEKIGVHIEGSEKVSFANDDDRTLANFFNNSKPLHIELDFYRELTVQENEYTTLLRFKTADEHTWLVSKAVGKGIITFTSHLDFIENATIGDYDHAEALWSLLHENERTPETVWLVAFDEQPSLFVLIWEKAWVLLISLALLFIFAIWHYSPRLGTLATPPALQRRRILEHIQASGQFLWFKQNQGKATLIHSLQEPLKELAIQRNPHWDHWDNQRRYAELSKQWQLPANKIQYLLEQSELNKNDFLLLAQLHQQLRMK